MAQWPYTSVEYATCGEEGSGLRRMLSAVAERVDKPQQHEPILLTSKYCTPQKHVRNSRVQGQVTVDTKLRAVASATRHLAPFALMLIEEHPEGSVHDRRDGRVHIAG